MKRIFTKDDFKTLKSITSSHQSNINLKELNSMNAILASAQILEQEKASENGIQQEPGCKSVCRGSWGRF